MDSEIRKKILADMASVPTPFGGFMKTAADLSSKVNSSVAPFVQNAPITPQPPPSIGLGATSQTANAFQTMSTYPYFGRAIQARQQFEPLLSQSSYSPMAGSSLFGGAMPSGGRPAPSFGVMAQPPFQQQSSKAIPSYKTTPFNFLTGRYF